MAIRSGTKARIEDSPRCLNFDISAGSCPTRPLPRKFRLSMLFGKREEDFGEEKMHRIRIFERMETQGHT